jgi:hypothetical protein
MKEHMVENDDSRNELTEQEVIEQSPVEATPSVATPPEEPTVGTGSYIAVSCAVVMLVLTVILIGVVYLLRWI